MATLTTDEFNALLKDTRGIVVGQCLSILRRAPACPALELQDLVQEVHVRLWERRELMAGAARDRACYVQAVAHNVALNAVRQMTEGYYAGLQVVSLCRGELEG